MKPKRKSKRRLYAFPELQNCKDCGQFFLKEGCSEHCNKCSDPYYLEEHEGG